ncbi:hypothetical protein AB1Y20_012911 [Prymnesium parvum]|uniref:Uncharacterized protein n=1 Tax=Prymnesium parvum TaxID=97485 RepID=A0AB34IJW8_PRYPA
MAQWTLHAKLNCWWNGNGAEDVDVPRGSSLPGVLGVEPCQQACARHAGCQGVVLLGQACFRKSAVDLRRCHADERTDFYLLAARVPPSPPPPPAAPPWPAGLPFPASFAAEAAALPQAVIEGQQFPRLGPRLFVGMGPWNSRGINLVRALRAMLGDASIFVESPQFTLRRLQLRGGGGVAEHFYPSAAVADWGGLALFRSPRLASTPPPRRRGWWRARRSTRRRRRKASRRSSAARSVTTARRVSWRGCLSTHSSQTEISERSSSPR